jgi:26S proteasome regulatory subunit N3
VKTSLLSWLPAAPVVDQSMDVDPAPTPSKVPVTVTEPVPEGEIYIRLLILHHLHQSPDTYKQSIDLSHETVDKMQALNRRSMDPIAAKVWYALERSYELGGELADARPCVFLLA